RYIKSSKCGNDIHGGGLKMYIKSSNCGNDIHGGGRGMYIKSSKCGNDIHGNSLEMYIKSSKCINDIHDTGFTGLNGIYYSIKYIFVVRVLRFRCLHVTISANSCQSCFKPGPVVRLRH
ncbi:MAG: hypothetical protein IJV14_07765, partial [Lachnospiraceae bacterium]|nr:hypothetical protein [Lachnospiraceae bacterium]